MDQPGNTDLTDRIRSALDDILGLAPPVDADGDWMISVGGQSVCVQALAEPASHAHIFSPVASNIGPEAQQEITDLNVAAAWAKIIRSPDGRVFAATRLHESALSAASLRHALMSVATYATETGPLLQAMFQLVESEDQTPTLITDLPAGSVFVFGSNAEGHHRHGASRTARKSFGARWGKREGLSDQSYAIPTAGGFLSFSLAVWRFLYFAREHPELTFQLTRVGCGRAGFDERLVAALFGEVPNNVIKPGAWRDQVPSGEPRGRR